MLGPALPEGDRAGRAHATARLGTRTLSASPEPEWDGPSLAIKSVGIDIGSTTSHLSLSQLTLSTRGGESWGSPFVISARESLYRSPVIFTPYVSGTEIDAQGVGAFLEECYREAGVAPEEIDTGAVIVTGEAARKENAERIVRLFAAESGKFVCASAGPTLEAIMAAHGSGSVEASREAPRDRPLLNVDIGGSTTKLALVAEGEVIETAAVNVGSRLVAYEPDGTIRRWETAGRAIAASIGLERNEGDPLPDDERIALARAMAGVLIELIRRADLSPLARQLMITEPLGHRGPLSGLVFSGGTAEYLYGRETGQFGDLGPHLAAAVLERLDDANDSPAILPSAEGLRATVIGASQYTVQVSGSTTSQSREGLLPLSNVPVVLQRLPEPLPRAEVAARLRRALAEDGLADRGTVALAFKLGYRPNYDAAKTLAGAVVDLFESGSLTASPLILVFDRDIARTVGEIIADTSAHRHDIVAVDEIDLKEMDYIDVGEPLIRPGSFSEHLVLPIVVKSLVFST